jgi:thiol-disulfide isomerase/thioredoxin
VRQQRSAERSLPKSTFFDESFETKGFGDELRLNLTLSGWQNDEWFYVASGPNTENFDAVVRLNPVALRKPGYGVQTFVGGFVYYFHGDAHILDDGELLVAMRTLEAGYKAELARKKIQANLAGAAVPAIDATSWLNSSGLTWGGLKGKVVLIDFWGTWCGPCVAKMPATQELAAKYAERGLVVVGIHSEQSNENCEKFVREKNITFPIAVDSGKTAETFAIDAWPSYFLIDKSGKVAWGYSHQLPTEEQIEDLLDK